jgi:hypothetical protein
MSALDALIAAGAMTMTPMPYVSTPMPPYVTTNYGPFFELQPGPGLYLEGDKLVAKTPLPSGTPVEGSELVTETKELVPCFAATIPACPGHWTTNTLNWVFKSGEWCRKDLLSATNVVSTNSIQTQTTNLILSGFSISFKTNLTGWIVAPSGGATNDLTDPRALRLEIEALEQQVKFWKGKAVGP